MQKPLSHRRLELFFKSFANHYRIKILELLKQEPELSVEDISKKLRIGYENASDHIRKLAAAGLVLKRNEGPSVRHKITAAAESILVFCKTLE